MANLGGMFEGLGEGMDDLRAAKETSLDMEYRNMRDANLRRWQKEDRAEDRAYKEADRAEDRQWSEEDDIRDYGRVLSKEERALMDQMDKEERAEKRKIDAADPSTPGGAIFEEEKERDTKRLMEVAKVRADAYARRGGANRPEYIDIGLRQAEKVFRDKADDEKAVVPRRMWEYWKAELEKRYDEIYGTGTVTSPDPEVDPVDPADPAKPAGSLTEYEQWKLEEQQRIQDLL